MVDPHSFEALRHQKVIVRANGFVYRGILVGADEEDVYLRGEMRWVVLPMSTVTDIKRDTTKEYPLGGWTPPSTPPTSDEPNASNTTPSKPEEPSE